MRFHPERYFGLGFVVLLLAVVGMPAADWWRVRHLPPAVQTALAEHLPGAKASSVQVEVREGLTVFALYVERDHTPYNVRVTADGNVLDVMPLSVGAREEAGG
jgi:hypothetical protein